MKNSTDDPLLHEAVRLQGVWKLGEAKSRGTKEQRVAQAKESNKGAAKAGTKISANMKPAEMMRLMEKAQRAEMLFTGLTTPKKINEQVIQFAHHLNGKPPIFLDCQPELWSRQSCCDLNVSKYIELHGGKMVSGYRVWYNEPRYIEGERHAVWTDGDVIRDVSFVDTGETTTVFIPDDIGFDDARGKVRFAFEEADKAALADYEAIMNQMPLSKMADAEAWATYTTYEEWLAGKRMPNIIPGFSN
jgi:hypothetical protein